jgi:hypothetical protein
MPSLAISKAAAESALDLGDLASFLRHDLECTQDTLSALRASIEPFLPPTESEAYELDACRAKIARLERGLRTLGRVHVNDVDGQLTLF